MLFSRFTLPLLLRSRCSFPVLSPPAPAPAPAPAPWPGAGLLGLVVGVLCLLRSLVTAIESGLSHIGSEDMVFEATIQERCGSVWYRLYSALMFVEDRHNETLYKYLPLARVLRGWTVRAQVVTRLRSPGRHLAAVLPRHASSVWRRGAIPCPAVTTACTTAGVLLSPAVHFV
jgi:hypothetical protein